MVAMLWCLIPGALGCLALGLITLVAPAPRLSGPQRIRPLRVLRGCLAGGLFLGGLLLGLLALATHGLWLPSGA